MLESVHYDLTKSAIPKLECEFEDLHSKLPKSLELQAVHSVEFGELRGIIEGIECCTSYITRRFAH
jgi:hypothetical protein